MTESAAIEHFTDLHLRHYREAYGYAVGRAARDLAEEVASEVFLITWRRLTDVPVPALPWLLAVNRNVVIDQFRVAARRQSVAELEAWTFEARATAADVADQMAERLVVLTALAQMSEASSR